MSNRNILNQGSKINNNVYVNTLSADEPLEITNNNNTASTISLKGLNSFGSSNQIIQVNSTADALEYSSTFTGDIISNNILNSNNNISLRYVKAVSPGIINRLELNNSTTNERLFIYNLENLFSRQDRLIIDNATDDLLKIGNSIDTLQLINAGQTITLPTSAGTLALSSEIPTNNSELANGAGYITIASVPTNNSELTNGAGYITGSSPTITSPTITGTGSITASSFSGNLSGNVAGNLTGSVFSANNTSLLSYTDNSPGVSRMELNNTGTDRLFIYNLEFAYSRQNRVVISNATDNLLKIGNATDTLELINAGQTITLPTSTGTLALTSQIPTNNSELANGAGYITIASVPTNNSELTNGAGYITGSSPTITSPTITGTGSITASSFTGSLSGNVTGNVSGNLTGNVFSSNNTSLLSYTNNSPGISRCELNNTLSTDRLLIYNLENMYSRQNKIIFKNTTDNEIEYGNTFDLVKLNHNGFQLKDPNGNIMLSNQLNSTSSRYNTVLGTGADNNEDVALTIRNKSGASSGDCRLRLRNTDTTSTSTNPVIELLQNTGSGYEGSYIYQVASSYDLLLQSSRNIGFFDNDSVTAYFRNQSLLFQSSTSDIYGNITTPAHPQTNVARMRDIYCFEIFCEEISSRDTILANKAFKSIYPYDSIQAITQVAPSATRATFLELGTDQEFTNPNDLVYPVSRINAPSTAGQWYNYVQDHTNGNVYFGWFWDQGFFTDYFLEFGSQSNTTIYGDVRITLDLDISGNLSKATGSFKIPHPLEEEGKKDKYLIHSFVEAPRCDNVYSGKIQLQNGQATVDLDNNDWYKMTSGTFNKLNKDLRILVSNNDFDNWDLVKGKIEGSRLIIISNNPKSNAVIDWMVIGTRQDDQVKESVITDQNGDLITERVEIRDEDTEQKIKQNKRNKENRERNIKNSKNQSRFKGLTKRFQEKTKRDNALHTAKRLIKKKKS